MNSMDINTIKLFLSIADGSTYASVAEESNISQSSLSKMIISLENELGVKLFDRSRRSVTLTLAGRCFYDSMKQLVPEFDKAAQSLRLYSASKVIYCGVITSLGVYNLREYMVQYSQRFPTVDLKILMPEGTSSAITDLLDGKYDFVIAHQPINNEACNTVVLHDDPLLAVIPISHRCTRQSTVRISDLKGENVYTDQSTLKTLRMISPLSDLAKAANSSFQTDLILSSVSFGNGVAILHESSLRSFKLDDVSVRRISDVPDTPVVIVFSKGNILQDYQNDFACFLAEAMSLEYKKLPAEMVI